MRLSDYIMVKTVVDSRGGRNEIKTLLLNYILVDTSVLPH